MSPLFLLLLMFPAQLSPTDKVREGYLDHNPYATVGLVIKYYKYFEKRTWTERKSTDGLVTVVFEGLINDDKAVDEFFQKNQYAFRQAFKAMQLEPYYGITKDKQKLRYVFRFKFDEKGDFHLASGDLGIQDSKGQWQDKRLEPKSVLAILEGIYSNENPYESLIKGLPFK